MQPDPDDIGLAAAVLEALGIAGNLVEVLAPVPGNLVVVIGQDAVGILQEMFCF